MASSASTVLRQELMAQGENDSTWGTKTNTNLGILESAIAGTTAISTTGTTTTLSNVDYTNDQAKKHVIDVSGTLVSNEIIVIPNASKTYKVFNRTTGSFTVTVKTSAGTGILVTQSTAVEIYCDGSNTVRYATPIVDYATGAPATASGAAASSVSVTPTGNLASTDAQAALAELQGDIDTLNTAILTYQPLDSDLTTIAGLAKTDSNFIVGSGAAWVVESGATARASMGLGTMATQASSSVAITGGTLTSVSLVTSALGTPSSGTLTSCTGLPISTGVSGLGSGVATFLATPSSANLATALTGETGTAGGVVFSVSPTFTGTPVAPTASSVVNNAQIATTAFSWSTLGAPSGTLMLFQQTSAPTGWTKQTTHNNKALRVVSGTASSGGTTTFTLVFRDRTITEANLPNHTHSFSDTSTSDGAHTHFVANVDEPAHPGSVTLSASNRLTGGTTGGSVVTYSLVGSATASTIGLTSSNGAHTHDVSGTTGTGSGSGTAMDFDVLYVDLIIAAKD